MERVLQYATAGAQPKPEDGLGRLHWSQDGPGNVRRRREKPLQALLTDLRIALQ